MRTKPTGTPQTPIRRPFAASRRAAGLVALAGLLLAASPLLPAGAATDRTEGPEFSRFLLGAYRKTMTIEEEIREACGRYGVPVPLARAVCMYESGGNDSLISHAGARGYFQVMPSTHRLMGVSSNIEAGVKYLGQMLRELGREDDALAAYNAGPGRVRRGSPMPIETLQYVVGVGYLRTLLVLEEPRIRAAASRLKLHRVRAGETWLDISEATGTSLLELRLYNPYLAERPLLAGLLVAYPPPALHAPGSILKKGTEPGEWTYLTLPGDLYLHLAFALDVSLERMRADNGLWRVQAPIAGMTLRIRPGVPAPPARGAGLTAFEAAWTTGEVDPAAPPAPGEPEPASSPATAAPDVTELAEAAGEAGEAPDPGETGVAPSPGAAAAGPVHVVVQGETLRSISEQHAASPWLLVRENGLWEQALRPGDLLRLPAAKAPARAAGAARGPAPPSTRPAVAKPPEQSRPRYLVHRVRRGETLTGIARLYGTTVEIIRSANSLRGSIIRVGQKLRIPQPD